MSRAMFGASNRRPKTGRGRMSIRLRLVLWSGRLFRDRRPPARLRGPAGFRSELLGQTDC
jgi:hypothetical protein